MGQESTAAIYTAAGANLAIAAEKFFGVFVTGSAAMLAEGVPAGQRTHAHLATMVDDGVAARFGVARAPGLSPHQTPGSKRQRTRSA